MLRIKIPPIELLNEFDMSFINIDETTLVMEHSLISISKWESKWHKPFLTDTEKTNEELLDYLKCMTINYDKDKVNDLVFSYIPSEALAKINKYINDPMTATSIKSIGGKKNNSEYITSELIYYWMIALNIPFECAKWHINRLLTLIEICDIKSKPEKKMSHREIMDRYSSINASRRRRLHTKG